MLEFIHPLGVGVGREHSGVHRGMVGQEYAERQQDEGRHPGAEPHGHDAALGDLLPDDRQGEVDDEEEDGEYQGDGDAALADDGA